MQCMSNHLLEKGNYYQPDMNEILLLGMNVTTLHILGITAQHHITYFNVYT